MCRYCKYSRLNLVHTRNICRKGLVPISKYFEKVIFIPHNIYIID